MNRLGRRFRIVVAYGVLATIVWALILIQREKAAVEADPEQAPTIQRAARPQNRELHERAGATARVMASRDWDDLIDWLRSDPPPSEDEIRAKLLSIRKSWTQMDPQDRAQMLASLLEGGEDASTHLSFKVGAHGMLAGWPTLRVFLLDLLATSDPEMAAATARIVLISARSAEEYAVALRSLTREGSGRAPDVELLDRFDLLLSNPAWQDSPGLAEAMDLPRLIGSQAAAERLTRWSGNPAIKAVAMEEFAAEHPLPMLEALQISTHIEPSTRAHLMARANPSDPAQIDLVNQYLRNPDLAESEVRTFLKNFPLRGATTGHRLYGGLPSPYHFEQVAADDVAALAQVSRWLARPEMQPYRQELLSLQERLADWVQQAKDSSEEN